MPITSSAKKALRQSKTRKKRNVLKKNKFKQARKEIQKAISLKDTALAKKKLSEFFKTLDKAAKAHTIHRNKANRLKSRISKKIR